MWRTLKFYFLSTIIVGLAGLALYYRYFPQRPGRESLVEAPAILRQIQPLTDLITVRYHIQKVIGLTEQKVPFGSEQVLMMVQAKVSGGVNLAEATTRRAGAAVVIQLPPARILDAALDDQETKVWDRSKTWWTPWVSLNPNKVPGARHWKMYDWRQSRWAFSVMHSKTPKQSSATFYRQSGLIKLASRLHPLTGDNHCVYKWKTPLEMACCCRLVGADRRWLWLVVVAT